MTLRRFENGLLDLIAATTPWLAPAIPATMVYANMQRFLGMGWEVALVGAVVVECLGLSAVHTAFQLWDYNDSREARQAPTGVAVASGVFYLALVIVVNVVMEVETAPVLHIVAKALFSLLGIVAGVVLAIRAQHARRLDSEAKAQRAEATRREDEALAAEEEREERRLRREERRAALQVAATTRPDLAAISPQVAADLAAEIGAFPGDFRQLTPAHKRQLAELNTGDIVRLANVSPRTARDWRRQLAATNGYHQEARAA